MPETDVFAAMYTAAIVDHSDRVRYAMAGGIGASWHAISEDSIYEGAEYQWALRIKNSRGSSWGGNPFSCEPTTGCTGSG